MSGSIQKIFTGIILICLVSCFPSSKHQRTNLLPEGVWRGALDIGEEEIPFLFEVTLKSGQHYFTFINGDEKISIQGTIVSKDSIIIDMPVFHSSFYLKSEEPNKLRGYWQNFNKSSEYIIPFTAEYGNKERFKIPENPVMGDLDYKWNVSFSPGSKDFTPAIGLFDVKQDGKTYGSFITETGDYRFLDGLFCDSLLRLSCFDGAHAFLFKANQLSNGMLQGRFWSGHSWREEWIASIDPNASLSHPDSLSKTIIPDDEISFSFKGLDGGVISLDDQKYQGKVVLVQIFGSWCPNCADESLFYEKLYDKYHSQGLEIIGLAFEASREEENARTRVMKFRSTLGLTYDMAIAGYYSKQEATEVLGFLDRVISFPTTLFIDRSGRVQKVHTGFYGPGTGVYYDQYVEETEKFIESLL